MSRLRIWFKPKSMCWPCVGGKCDQAVKDNTCYCCRANHRI